MRIISNFKDYYDAVMKSGMDREVVYVRETKDIDLEENYGIDFGTKISGSYHEVEMMFLGYCGKIHKVIRVSHDAWGPKYLFYDFQDFKNFMLLNKLANEYDFRISKWWANKYQKFDEFDPNKLTELFHKHQTPLFLVTNTSVWRGKDRTTMTLGPCLKDLEFYRVKDTHSAYQDIFQFVAGVLNSPENKMVKISDQDKIHKHGFDKWSFRKMPTKGKKK